MSISGIALKSVRRRYRQIIRASLTTLLAVFFVTAVLIFEENMYQWQMASNKDRFGDWFIMEIGSKEPNYNLTSHIYLEQPVTINRSVCGTADKPINLVAESISTDGTDGVVLSGAGLTVIGNYWLICKGFIRGRYSGKR